MFFKFLPPDKHPEELWAPMWDIEVAIQALLMDDDNREAWKALPPETLAETIRQLILEYGLLMDAASNAATLALLDQVLRSGAPSILSFLQRIQEPYTNDPFMPDADLLIACVRQSGDFKAHVQEKAKYVRERLQEQGDNNHE